MPRCCSVKGCKSNYRSEKVSVTTYVLPKDEVLRSQWLRKIPTDFTGLKNPIVCIKHFQESDIIRTDKCIVKGELKEYERKIPKLKHGAVPSVFPNLPKYLSETPSSSKRIADVEVEYMETAVRESLLSLRTYEKEREVKSLDDIVVYFHKSDSFHGGWKLFHENNKVFLCYIDVSQDSPCIAGSVTILNNLECVLTVKGEKLNSKCLPKKLQVLKSVDVLEELLKFVQCKCTVESDKCKLDLIIEDLSCLSNNSENGEQLSFIVEQLKLARTACNNRRYSGYTLILAASIFVQSSAAYSALYKSKCIYLPHIRNLKKLISQFSLTDINIEGSINYLKTKLNVLKNHEFTVNLHLDEIYINPKLNFKGGTVFGCCENNSSEVAKTAQVFMISSMASKYMDVVSIIPVTNLTAVQLKKLALKVLEEVEKIGFKIIALVSDNNNVNRKMFELLSEHNILQPSIPHPLDNTRQLFFIFDVVHIIKCVRNNWLSKKTSCFIFPDFDSNDSNLLKAQYRQLELMYEKEKNSLVKFAHLLSNKVLYPSSIQKQNVNLALRIFDERNIAALKCISQTYPETFNDVEDTCKFLNIFSTWWKIVNVKSALEGQRFNDIYREPVRPGDSLQIQFLRKMTLWLKNWRQSVPISDSLSAQTFQSLINTTDAFLLLIPYMFSKYNLNYILLSKFQNDVLEGRFGCYRQLSGANYYISFVQLLESERKMRFKSAVLISSRNRKISLRTLLPCNDETVAAAVDIGPFSSVINQEFSLQDVPEQILPILTYISGYAVRKELRFNNCRFCKVWLQLDKEVDVEMSAELINELDRGKLILPSEHALISVSIAWFVLQKIIDNFQSTFLNSVNQLSILYKISCMILNKYCERLNECFTELDECEVCNESIHNKLKKINLCSCKIMINNLVKTHNDKRKSEIGTERKIKKLKSS